jgi:hypothetical protein
MKIEDKINKYLGEKELSPYQKFFKALLKEYGVSSPDELSKEEKKKFFNEVDKK